MIRTKPRYLTTGSVTLTVIRQPEGTWVNGRYVKATPVEIEITGNIQPLPRGIRTKLAPEGDRTTGCFMLFSNEMVRQQKEGTNGYEADIVLFNGEELEVVQAYDYSMGPLNHYEAVCVRKELT
jgi:hypothetical protein